MQTANRLEGIAEYYFSQKLREIEELNKQGKNIINLGIGSPDLPPHPDVIQVLQEESMKSSSHAYQSYKGSPVFRKAISEFYHTWYGVDIDPDNEILPLIGSKEGIVHLCMTYINEGDFALIPNPGYPTYKSAVLLAGGSCITYELNASNHWMPDFESIEKYDLSKVKMMWVNYPHMPSGTPPNDTIFKKLIDFGIQHNILICHDNPYSFILNETPRSILAVEGAMNIAVELNSLSKSHNMAGWRVGMLLGAKDRINDVLRFKSNMDSGMFLPIQLSAAKALSLGNDWFHSLNNIYSERRNKVYTLFERIGCDYSKNQVGLFVWGKISNRYLDGFQLSDYLLYNHSVFLTPGGIFGTQGNDYIRISLCSQIQNMEAALIRLENYI